MARKIARKRSMPLQTTPPEYLEWLRNLKGEIQQARHRAALAVNSELILLYWRIGREILERQATHGWGARVIDQLAADLHSEFPDVKGFSPRNLKYMRKFAQEWGDSAIVQQVVAQLPWGQNVLLLDSVPDEAQRLWYARAAVEHGWSRNILKHQIETKLYDRQGRAITNFTLTMTSPGRCRSICSRIPTFSTSSRLQAMRTVKRPFNCG